MSLYEEYNYEPYYEDEYEQDYDEWHEDHFMGSAWEVHKAQNGQLYAVEITLWKEDFGIINSHSERTSLSGLSEVGQRCAIRIGRNLNPGESAEMETDESDYDDDSDDDDYYESGTFYDDLPFSERAV